MLQTLARKTITVGTAEYAIGDLVSHTRFDPSRPYKKLPARYAILTQIYADVCIEYSCSDDPDSIYFGILFTDEAGLVEGTLIRHHTYIVKEESLPAAVYHLGRVNETLN